MLGPLRAVLGPLGIVLRPLGAVLDASWGLWGDSRGHLGLLLEPLGRVPGASWSDLGASWSGLGTSWDGLGRYVAATYFLKKIKMDFESILRPKRLPKGSQNGAKNDPKSKHKLKMKKAALWDRIWVVLGSFWCQSWGQKSLKFIGC